MVERPSGGTVNLQTGRAVLPGGSLTLAHHQLHGSSTFSGRTCLATVTSSGTYRITGGTGRYRLIRGHGDYRLTAYAIVAKVRGKCATNVVPYAQETPAHRIRADPAVATAWCSSSADRTARRALGAAP